MPPFLRLFLRMQNRSYGMKGGQYVFELLLHRSLGRGKHDLKRGFLTLEKGHELDSMMMVSGQITRMQACMLFRFRVNTYV